jgi:hypothetical protein
MGVDGAPTRDVVDFRRVSSQATSGALVYLVVTKGKRLNSIIVRLRQRTIVHKRFRQQANS